MVHAEPIMVSIFTCFEPSNHLLVQNLLIIYLASEKSSIITPLLLRENDGRNYPAYIPPKIQRYSKQR